MHLKNGNYRFYIHSRYRHPDLDGPVEYRAICESGGFGKLEAMQVSQGLAWNFEEVAELIAKQEAPTSSAAAIALND